jgi:hypothetical protein
MGDVVPGCGADIRMRGPFEARYDGTDRWLQRSSP